jgi:hypothetical protein
MILKLFPFQNGNPLLSLSNFDFPIPIPLTLTPSTLKPSALTPLSEG